MSVVPWKARAEAVTDVELAEFRRRICVHAGHPLPGHIGLMVIGVCPKCGGGLPSISMSLCASCALDLGVCQYDMRIVGWGTNSVGSREENAVLWLALLMRGYFAERSAAMRALERWPDPQVAAAARSLAPLPDRPAPGRSPVEAELLVGFVGAVPPEVSRGSRYCDALVVDVDVRLRCATLRTADAARCEALTKRDPTVRYLSLNRALPELEP